MMILNESSTSWQHSAVHSSERPRQSSPRKLNTYRRTSLPGQAHRAALAVRARLGIGLLPPLSAVDAALALGVEVRFLNAPSMEGMYSASLRTIVISAERPSGRQSFTCAHELGHHVFGHGNRIDEFRSESSRRGRSAQEYSADLFAGFLLMPRYAVEQAFHVRGFSSTAPHPDQVYAVACQLGVGYSTLIHHMRSAIKLIPESHAQVLRRTGPKEIRARLVGRDITGDVWQVDDHWRGRPLDVRVGDVLLVERRFNIQSSGLTRQGHHEGSDLFELTAPGTFKVTRPGLPPIEVRVARLGYEGRACFRHLEG